MSEPQPAWCPGSAEEKLAKRLSGQQGEGRPGSWNPTGAEKRCYFKKQDMADHVQGRGGGRSISVGETPIPEGWERRRGSISLKNSEKRLKNPYEMIHACLHPQPQPGAGQQRTGATWTLTWPKGAWVSLPTGEKNPGPASPPWCLWC